MRFDNFSAIDSGIIRTPQMTSPQPVMRYAPRVVRKMRNRKRMNFFFGVAGAEGYAPYTLVAGQVIPNATINDIGASFIDIKQNDFDLGVRDINLGDFDIVSVEDTSMQDPTSSVKSISGYDLQNGAIVTIRLNKDVQVGVPTTPETAMEQAQEPMATSSMMDSTRSTSATTATQTPLKTIGLLAVGFFGGILAYKFLLKK
jgi:hypothetical protein